jgi:hypothetical protein
MFKVDVKSQERCADVDFVLKVIESVSGEEENRAKEIAHHTRVRDGVNVSTKVNHKMSEKHRLVNWEFEVVGCVPCGAAQPD